MRVYLLMQYGGQDESDIVLGTFLSRKDAAATLAALEAVPWQHEPEDHGPGQYHKREPKIEGHEWIPGQWCFDSMKDPRYKGPWPPKFPAGVVEVEVLERPLAVGIREEESPPPARGE